MHFSLTRRGVALSALLLTLAACSPSTSAPSPSAGGAEKPGGTNTWEQTVADAKKEGSVVIVSHTNLLYRDTIEKFKARYPEIQVEHVAIRPSEFARTGLVLWRGS